MTTKPKILFCTESAHIKSGYGNYTRSILQRLYDTQKYDIAELSCYRTVDHPKEYGWKIYPNAVEQKDTRFNQYNSNISNGFGQWRFDLVVAHFKPDIVIDFRDIFMTTFERTSVFRDKFHWVLAPTIDSFPIRHEWVDLLQNCDTLLTHTGWAKNTIEQLYGIPVVDTVPDSIDTSVFQPMNKLMCRTKLGLGMHDFIIGSVMRNQKRKLIPDLFQVISKLNKKLDHAIYLYLHTSYPETMGWDIPDLLLEYKIHDKVFFTYVCKQCKFWTPMKWRGAQVVCPKCKKKQMTLASVSNGISDASLAQIYNTFDIYIQYAVCEGFGIPPLEAASCGIPCCAVDHGAMAELMDDLSGIKIPIACTFRDQENNSDRAYPDNDQCVDILHKFYNLSIIDKIQISENHRREVVNKHSWDRTAHKFEVLIDNIDTLSPNRWQPIPEEHFDKIEKSFTHNANNRDFIYNIVDNLLEFPDLKSSFFIQQLIMAVDNGYILSEKKIIPYTQKDALKTLEVLFNNKIMLNKFLADHSIIKQNDFLNYQ